MKDEDQSHLWYKDKYLQIVRNFAGLVNQWLLAVQQPSVHRSGLSLLEVYKVPSVAMTASSQGGNI